MAKTIPADVLTKIIEHRPHLKNPTRGKIRAGNACTKEGIPKFYTARTKRAVNSLTVERVEQKKRRRP